ncbi:hypothetical protein BD310DRAFT_600581 [Dichomitus squalens]|uniref:Uncharacterized protein n=1 Tax=Dichomitus squalens TaxID=114155 RepID=A0A4Q9PQU1_9APHY|nr:hypothetical protein BD310DRAFT_600581 [Dichomitus squalens]
MHPEHIQNVNTYEVPMGSTIEFRLAPAQQPAVQHASSSSSTSTSAPGPANPQPTVPAHQQTRYSGSQLHHQANYSGAAQGIAAGPDPTVHAGAPMSIDGPPDARDFPRGPARMGRTASTTTAPITPDVLRQGLWKLNGNEDASRDRNGEDGNEASIATRDWERREVPARYQERNPGYRPESSPSTASSPSSSSGTPIDSGKEPPRDDPPLNGVRIITEDGNTYYLMADTDARNGLEEYQRLHPDRKLPSHRTAKPGKSALRGAPQNQERDAGLSATTSVTKSCR